MNVNKILCPVDFSEYGTAALRYAESLAGEYGAELHLVHVYEQPFAVDGGFASQPLPPADLDAERARLDSVEVKTDLPVTRAFIEGSAADELVEYANQQQVDMIVMGTHGRTGLGRLLMGSVAEAIVRRAECPVLTIKQPIAVAS